MPTRLGAVTELQHSYYDAGPPANLKHDIVIGIPSGDYDAFAHLGALPRVSPCEYVHAVILGLEAAVEKKAPDADIRKWRAALLSCSFEFCVIPEDKLRFRAMQLREDARTDADAVQWTALQKIWVVMCEWTPGVTTSAAKLAKKFSDNLKQSTRSEKYSVTFIDSALTVHQRLLSLPRCKALLVELDTLAGIDSPFNSVFKLNHLVSKCKTPSCIESTLFKMIHGWRLGHLELEDFATRKLHEWLIQMYILKDKMQHYLLNDFVAKHKFPIEDVVQIRAAFADTDSARKKLANYPSELPADTYWKSTMCDASQEFCAFVENMCIGTDYNGTLKTALKAIREPAAVLGYQHIKDAVERVLENLEKHLTANSKALAPIVEVVDKMPEAPEVPENQRLGTPLATVQTLLLANPDESDHWRAVAERRAQQYIKLVHVSSLSELEAQLSSSSIACTKGDLTGLVGFLYDTKLAGEAATNPQVRICPLQENTIKARCVPCSRSDVLQRAWQPQAWERVRSLSSWMGAREATQGNCSARGIQASPRTWTTTRPRGKWSSAPSTSSRPRSLSGTQWTCHLQDFQTRLVALNTRVLKAHSLVCC